MQTLFLLFFLFSSSSPISPLFFRDCSSSFSPVFPSLLPSIFTSFPFVFPSLSTIITSFFPPIPTLQGSDRGLVWSLVSLLHCMTIPSVSSSEVDIHSLDESLLHSSCLILTFTSFSTLSSSGFIPLPSFFLTRPLELSFNPGSDSVRLTSLPLLFSSCEINISSTFSGIQISSSDTHTSSCDSLLPHISVSFKSLITLLHSSSDTFPSFIFPFCSSINLISGSIPSLLTLGSFDFNLLSPSTIPIISTSFSTVKVSFLDISFPETIFSSTISLFFSTISLFTSIFNLFPESNWIIPISSPSLFTCVSPIFSPSLFTCVSPIFSPSLFTCTSIFSPSSFFSSRSILTVFVPSSLDHFFLLSSAYLLHTLHISLSSHSTPYRIRFIFGLLSPWVKVSTLSDEVILFLTRRHLFSYPYCSTLSIALTTFLLTHWMNCSKRCETLGIHSFFLLLNQSHSLDSLASRLVNSILLSLQQIVPVHPPR